MKKGFLVKVLENEKYVSRETFRNYIGASSIGAECLRQIWYEYKKEEPEKVTPRLRRVFDTGKLLETYLLDLLEQRGVPLLRPHPANHFLEFFDHDLPYLRGHCDAIIHFSRNKSSQPVEIILEIKTANDANFNIFVKKGLKEWNPKYYAQVQSYMGMSQITTSIILVINKDNGAVYDEVIHFDKDFYESLKDKAKLIHDAKIMPPRISSTPIWYQCKLCKFNKVCFK